MNVRDVMTSNPRTCQPHSTIKEAAILMRDEDTGVIPVVSDGKVVGMVTDRDIVVRAVAEGGSFDQHLHDVLSGDIVFATPDMPTSEAADLMAEHQIRRLPVIENGKLVGIVSLGDLAVKDARDQRTGDTLENISAGVKQH